MNEYQLGFRMVQQDTDGLAAVYPAPPIMPTLTISMIFDGFGEYVDHDYAGYDQRHADDRPHIEPLPEQQRGGQRHEHDTHADQIAYATPTGISRSVRLRQ